MNNLQTQIDSLRTLQESYDQLGAAAEAYNTGKTELAANITAKGVEASASETLPELAEKVNAISQESYTINGGEMYAKQLFGSLETPNYWNLYDILAQLLSDGRLVQYGGILLAEYYRGYDSLALAGAGASGAYVVSDKDENGQFKMYTNDTTHVWDTEFDGKGNRWAAYCFADEYHDFQITDTNTSPRSIFIGRKVGTITSLVDGRCSQVVVPDGNELDDFIENTTKDGWFKQNFGRVVVIRNISKHSGLLLSLSKNTRNFSDELPVELVYLGINNMDGGTLSTLSSYLDTFIVEGGSITGGALFERMPNTKTNCALKNIIIKAETLHSSLAEGGANRNSSFQNVQKLIISSEDVIFDGDISEGKFSDSCIVLVNYLNNNKNKSVVFSCSFGSNAWLNIKDVHLMQGWCKPIDLHFFNSLTEANMYAHILQRLKQDESDCGSGVTITLGSTNLEKLTSQESQDLLASLRGTYGYTFA